MSLYHADDTLVINDTQLEQMEQPTRRTGIARHPPTCSTGRDLFRWIVYVFYLDYTWTGRARYPLGMISRDIYSDEMLMYFVLNYTFNIKHIIYSWQRLYIKEVIIFIRSVIASSIIITTHCTLHYYNKNKNNNNKNTPHFIELEINTCIGLIDF